MNSTSAFLFDLDGTLIDSVYQHVAAWRAALERFKLPLSQWRIHRRVGMSGGLIAHALARETGHSLSPEEIEQLQRLHTKEYLKMISQVRPLPGAVELLAKLTRVSIPWTIATSSTLERARFALPLLKINSQIPVVTRDQVQHGKPDPDLFLKGAERLGVSITDCIVVGDSVWDHLAARRARALSVGLLSGGYSAEELTEAGAYRVYDDPSDLLRHLDELGIRLPELSKRKTSRR